MDNFSHFSPRPKRYLWILWIIIAIVAVGSVAAITVIVLKNTQTAQKSATASPSSIVDPTTVITTYTKSGTIAAYSNDYQLSHEAGQPVYSQSGGQQYGVEIQAPAAQNATYTVPGGHSDDSKAIMSQTQQFLTSLGFKVIPGIGSSASNSTTYSDTSTICQYRGQAPGNYGGSYSLTCVSSKQIQQEYAAVAQLVALYNKGHAQASYTQIDRSQLVTQGDKSLAVVTFYQGKASSQQLFAAINHNWEFIVTLSSGTITNGKYSTSPEVEAALNNPKYGSFLQDNL